MKTTDSTQSSRTMLKPLVLALALGAGSALAQTTINVGGAGVIGDSTLITNVGVATLPANGANWTASGGNGNTFSSLTSPSALVGTTGNVTLTFSHRYNFETDVNGNWDGGAVFVSVNAGPYTKVPLASFTSNGYNGVAVASVWAAADEIFSGQSAGWGTPALISSVADLGPLTAGDTVSVEFRGGWDGNTNPAAPNWEIGTVNIADTGATLLDKSFTVDGAAGFTASFTGTGNSPWIYSTPIFKFELDANTDTADRYVPDIAGSVINLNNAKFNVVILNGTLLAGDTFSLFDLSGGTALTGSIANLSLPGGVIWNTTNLATLGTISVTAVTEADGTWTYDGATVPANWSDTTKWAGGIVADWINRTASFTANITAARTVTLDTNRTIGNITFTDSTTSSHDLTIASSPATNTLTLDVSSGTPVIDVTQSTRRFTISSPIAGNDGLTKNGLGWLILSGTATNYSGSTTINDGVMDFTNIPVANIGGGSGRNITVAANKIVRRNALDNAFLNRLVETANEICLMTGTTSNSFDLSSSTGANLPGAFIANFATNGAKCELSGTITPGTGGYRLGNLAQAGALGITQTSLLSGSNGLIVAGNRVVIVGAHTFTGDTTIRDGGRLGLSAFTGGTNSLALQNSALDLGSPTSTGTLFLEAGSTAGPISGSNLSSPTSLAQGTISATFGGLKGSKNFLSAIVTGNTGNNTAGTATNMITGFTLNPGTAVSCTYSGIVADFASGVSLVMAKSGDGLRNSPAPTAIPAPPPSAAAP